MLHRKLIVQNLSLSTDATDLFGGFRPVSLRQVILYYLYLLLPLPHIIFNTINTTPLTYPRIPPLLLYNPYLMPLPRI